MTIVGQKPTRELGPTISIVSPVTSVEQKNRNWGKLRVIGEAEYDWRERFGHNCAVVVLRPREKLPESHWSDLNRRPLDYESRALPLSYSGGPAMRGRV